jgi:hypothetical protein
MNHQQILSFIRWVQATIGPILIAKGYVSESTLPMVAGVVVSLVPLVWSMFVHTDTNAIKVVDTIAQQPNSPVVAIITEPTPAGKAIAASLPGKTTVVAGTPAAIQVSQ